jgi:hypothetical protein
VVVLTGGVEVSYWQFYVTDGWSDQPLFEEAFHGQANGLCGAQTRRGLFLSTGLHGGRVPVEVQVLHAEPLLESDWEEAVEVSVELAGPELVVLGWGGASSHTVPLPIPGTYRFRYCASGMDAGRRQDTILGDEPSPDRYRLQCWPAPMSPDAILRQTSAAARSAHAGVRDVLPPPAPSIPAEPMSSMTVELLRRSGTDPRVIETLQRQFGAED